MPEPISTTSGASRPKQPASEKPGASTASSGSHQRSAYSSQASCWRGLNLLPRRE